MSPYPKTVAEILDDSRKYKPAVLKALRRFKNSRPWRGTLSERGDKLRRLHRSLCKAYRKTIPLVIDVPEAEQQRGNGCYDHESNEIILTGKLSVLTYLHEFAHATTAGEDEFKACAWSVNLYKRIFPRSWARMKSTGHLVTKPAV